MTHDIYIGESSRPEFPQDYDLNLSNEELATKIGTVLNDRLSDTEGSELTISIITRPPIAREFEFPVIVTVRADSRDEAENEISDLADCIADTFPERIAGTSALVSVEHNTLDRLGIDPRGKVVS